MLNHPLALCDPKTVQDNHLVKVDRVSDTYAGEVCYLSYAEGQRWYWVSSQDVNEAWVFLSFDSWGEQLGQFFWFSFRDIFADMSGSMSSFFVCGTWGF